jgi:hypothetical protein
MQDVATVLSDSLNTGQVLMTSQAGHPACAPLLRTKLPVHAAHMVTDRHRDSTGTWRPTHELRYTCLQQVSVAADASNSTHSCLIQRTPGQVGLRTHSCDVYFAVQLCR